MALHVSPDFTTTVGPVQVGGLGVMHKTWPGKRLVQPELMAGLFAMSVAKGIPAAFAMALHVSPDFTTTVGPAQVGGLGVMHKTWPGKRLVQPELMAGLFAMSVAKGIPAAFAMALHVSPDFTTTVGPAQVGGLGVMHKTWPGKRLVQPELMAGLFVMSVATGIPTALAMALHVSPDFTTTVGPVQVDRGAGTAEASVRKVQSTERESSCLEANIFRIIQGG